MVRRVFLIALVCVFSAAPVFAACGPWTGQAAALADLSLQLPVTANFGQSSLSLTCHQETPHPGVLYPCQAFATTDVIPGPSGWAVQRLFSLASGNARMSGSLLLDERACPQFIAYYDPATNTWSGYKAIR